MVDLTAKFQKLNKSFINPDASTKKMLSQENFDSFFNNFSRDLVQI